MKKLIDKNKKFRVNVYMRRQQDDGLEKIAQQEDTSKAELIRQAIDEFLERKKQKKKS